MVNKVTILKVEGSTETSFQTKDNRTISGTVLTCQCEAGGQNFTVPITAYGKLADVIVGGVDVNISKGQDESGATTYTAKKTDNTHLVPATGGGGGRGGGISKSDLIFLAAVSIMSSSQGVSLAEAVSTANEAFDGYKALRNSGPQSQAPEPSDDNVPF